MRFTTSIAACGWVLAIVLNAQPALADDSAVAVGNNVVVAQNGVVDQRQITAHFHAIFQKIDSAAVARVVAHEVKQAVADEKAATADELQRLTAGIERRLRAMQGQLSELEELSKRQEASLKRLEKLEAEDARRGQELLGDARAQRRALNELRVTIQQEAVKAAEANLQNSREAQSRLDQAIASFDAYLQRERERFAYRLGAVGVGILGVLGVTVGATLYASARSDMHASDPECNDQDICTQKGVDLRESAKTAATASTVTTLLGLAGIGSGVVLWLVAPSEGSAAAPRPPASARMGLAVELGSTSQTVGVRGRF
jgi:hypothetical protein